MSDLPKKNDWVRFSERLPTRQDANANGCVIAKLLVGPRSAEDRLCMWNWVPPTDPDAEELWAANGFFAWRKE